MHLERAQGVGRFERRAESIGSTLVGWPRRAAGAGSAPKGLNHMTEDFTRPAGDPRTLGQDPAGPAPVGPPVTPPPPAGAPTPVSTGPVEESGSQGGTGDKAKQEAANVAGNAKEQASEVAGSAKEQASEVAGNAKEQAAKVAGTAKEETQRTVGEAKRQAQDLLRQSQSELSSQAGVQQQRLAETLRSFSGELGQMADSSEEPGLAPQVARWASQVSDDAGRWLEDRDPSSVFEDRKSTRLNSSHVAISYAVFCLKKR